jgi:hypothetical protein
MQRVLFSSDKKQTFVSPDKSHHMDVELRPLYAKRFKEVLSFHSPENLAAATEEGPGGESSSFHINLSGEPAYSPRFDRTFG